MALFAVGLLLALVASAVFFAAGGAAPGVVGVLAAAATVRALALWRARRPSASTWSNTTFAADLIVAALDLAVAWVHGFGWEVQHLSTEARQVYQGATAVLLIGGLALAGGLTWTARFDLDAWIGYIPPPPGHLDARKLVPIHLMFFSGATVAAYVGWRAGGWISVPLAGLAVSSLATSWAWYHRKRWGRRMRAPLMLVFAVLAFWGAVLSVTGTTAQSLPFLVLCLLSLASNAATVVVGIKCDFDTWWGQ